MVKNYISRSCYSACATSAANPLARSVAASPTLCCAQPCHCVCTKSANVRAALTMGTRSRFFFLRFLCEKPSSRYSLVRILPTSSSKSAPGPSVYLKRKPTSRYSPVRFLPATFPDRGKQRPYRGDPRSPEPHCPKKRTVSCLRVFSPVNSDASEHLS